MPGAHKFLQGADLLRFLTLEVPSLLETGKNPQTERTSPLSPHPQNSKPLPPQTPYQNTTGTAGLAQWSQERHVACQADCPCLRKRHGGGFREVAPGFPWLLNKYVREKVNMILRVIIIHIRHACLPACLPGSWLAGWLSACLFVRLFVCLAGCVLAGWMDGWMNSKMAGWMDGGME